jgi:heat-inducible transcriptional repressor
MLLNDRKLKILEAIVNDYIKNAEPVGSRTIAKRYDFGISPATIRNEMSDLEDLGLILQPHASSGRVPSDKGYRLYVDSIMDYRELTVDEKTFLEHRVLYNLSNVDEYMKDTAKILSKLTNYTTIITKPKAKIAKIKLIQLLPLDNVSIVMVLITDTKVVKNYKIQIGSEIKYEFLNNLSECLNDNLFNLDIDSISMDIINKITNITPEERDILKIIFESIGISLYKDDQVSFYTSGANNILDFPEFSDIVKARNIFQTFEENEMLITLLNDTSSDNIQIVIGAENSLENMKNCSIIKANYKLNKETFGSIGIIGPTRMNYIQVASILNDIVKSINLALKSLSDDV